MFVLLGDCIWWKQAEDEMTNSEVGLEDKLPKELTVHFDVTCPWCLSDDTKPKNKAMDIYECSECGEVFARPLS